MNPHDEAPLPATERSDEMTPESAAPAVDSGASSLDGMVDQARDLFVAALASFQSSLGVLRTEVALAKSSASSLIVIAAVMLVLVIGAWLAVLALIAAAVYELAGNWFLGIGSVVLLNGIGIAWLAIAMRQRLRDITMPRTRSMLSGLKPTPDASAQTRDESPR